ncbi:hypothetical protein NHX12_009615 [Muraenolepis orangiensis]|uniref:CLOCK-interacting pacemaker-like n=1 Tax=Muraenolepis orangiensis TaxID=630683 RepID=A0A9Q0I9N6_9TELE|nr:hypothetical protein NHX12_009615 [Muraenolepis orangiensis]
MGERLWRFDSEKDSGYSEVGSDSVQSDPEDQRSSVSQPHRKNRRSVVTIGNSGSSGVGAPNCYQELNPVYVIKNLGVKPSRPEQQQLPPPLTWAGGWHILSGSKGPTQLLLIQQPAMAGPSSSSFLTPTSVTSGRKGCHSRTSHKNRHHQHQHHHQGTTKNSYLPILNSYPRITPRPREESQSQGKTSGALDGVKESGGGGGGEGPSQSKRVCTAGEMKSKSTTTRNRSSHHHHHHRCLHRHHKDLCHSQHQVRCGSETRACPPSTSHGKSYRRSHHSSCSDGVSSSSVSSSSSHSPTSSSSSSYCPTSYTSPSSLAVHSPYLPRQVRATSAVATAAASGHLCGSPPVCSSVRQRRFLDAAEILSQSGLLAITLRTKELLKQSEAAEREIAQLRQHTQLLCRAALAGRRVPDDGSGGLRGLLQAMAHSGSYPSLDSGGHAEAIEDNQKHGEPGVGEGAAPPSPLLALSPEAAGSLSTDKDLTHRTMSPESSTVVC